MDNKRCIPEGFRLNKALGQNFLTDINLLDAIAGDAGVTAGDDVVEIGTGAGTLTAAILRKGASVYTFEVDRRLEDVIRENLSDFSDYHLFFADILRLKDDELKAVLPDTFKVVANLPYYVTTPLIMRFLNSSLGFTDLTLTVQKEVAERLCATEGTGEYSAITVSVQSICDVKITRIVDRKMFLPAPNVDSAVVRLTKHDNKFGITDRALFERVVKSVFCARRKTLENNLKSAFSLDKETACAVIEKLGYPPQIRGEKLSVDEFRRLSELVGEALVAKN